MEKDKGKEAAIAQETYEAKVGREMLERCGKNKNGKGVVHEILYRDKLNVDPKNIITGKRAKLAKSPTAVRDDILVTKDGKIVERIQLKDTEKSVQHTVKQGATQKYRGTKLKGTIETDKAYAKAAQQRKASGKGEIQKMTSTGISSNDTSRIADKALGKGPTFKGTMAGAKTAGISGGIVSGLVSVGSDLLDDKPHDCGEIISDAGKSSASGYVSGAAGFVGAEVAGSLVTNPIGKAIAPIIGAAVAAKAATAVSGPIIEGVADAVELGDPSFVADGVKESGETLLHGMDEAGGAILTAAGGVVDGACSALDSISDAINSSSALDSVDSFFDSIADFFDWY